jgi:outer membrane immunogenic protein
VGAAFFERALIYATGGLAYGETVITNRFICPTCVPPAAITSSSSDVSFGWTAGAGGEYALTDHLSLKAEALYYDLGDRSTTLTYNYVPANTSTLTSSAEFTGVIARGGINWRF